MIIAVYGMIDMLLGLYEQLASFLVMGEEGERNMVQKSWDVVFRVSLPEATETLCIYIELSTFNFEADTLFLKNQHQTNVFFQRVLPLANIIILKNKMEERHAINHFTALWSNV